MASLLRNNVNEDGHHDRGVAARRETNLPCTPGVTAGSRGKAEDFTFFDPREDCGKLRAVAEGLDGVFADELSMEDDSKQQHKIHFF